jgi:anti-sigma B factor antagonist
VHEYLSVSVRGRGPSIVVEVDGELDLASAPQLEDALERAWREAPDTIVLDLENLRFIDMSGLRLLLGASQRAEERGTELTLTNVRESIRRVLTLVGVYRLLPIRDG